MGAGDASPLVAPNEKADCGFCELEAEVSFLPKDNVDEDAAEPAEAPNVKDGPDSFSVASEAGAEPNENGDGDAG